MKKSQKSKGTRVTKAEFDAFKTLQANGLNTTDVSRAMRRSSSVASYIFRSETFEEYQAYMRRRFQDMKKDKKSVESPAIESAVTPAEVTPATSNQDTLERIAVALENLVEAWNNKPERKKFF